MDPLLDLLGWVILVATILGAGAFGLVLLGLLNAASGGGVARDISIPPGFTHHAAEVEARLRARYLKRQEPRVRLAPRLPRPAVLTGEGPAARAQPRTRRWRRGQGTRLARTTQGRGLPRRGQ